jgi:hypothetical protein
MWLKAVIFGILKPWFIWVGEYKDDVKCGQGTMTYNSGNSYTGTTTIVFFVCYLIIVIHWIGEWENDSKNGFGTYTFSDGAVYTGKYIVCLVHVFESIIDTNVCVLIISFAVFYKYVHCTIFQVFTMYTFEQVRWKMTKRMATELTRLQVETCIPVSLLLFTCIVTTTLVCYFVCQIISVVFKCMCDIILMVLATFCIF